MSTKRISTNAIYLIAIAVIIVAFLLLGGGPWIRGLIHHTRPMGGGMAQWNWVPILISLAVGFLIGLVVSGRRR